MKGTGSKEQIELDKKYVFFSDPDTISKRAEQSAGALQNQQLAQVREDKQCTKPPVSDKASDPTAATNLKNFESFLSYEPVQPYPFTFITAVKRKLALAAYHETSKKAYNLSTLKTADPLDIHTDKIDTGCKESLYQTVQKMDFIKPLKVPDVKISPKTLDYSLKDGQNLRDVTPNKFGVTAALQKGDKTPKSMERAHRKLDFSLSEGHSLISSDDIEPLKAPDLSISPGLTKKKDYIRDSSREKENRTKRIKKDDSCISKGEDMSHENLKRMKNPKHVSRKDVADPKRSKNERSVSHLSRESDFTSKKPKSKNFATSTVKKDDDKRLRSSSIHSTKTSRDRSLESRGRTFSSESLSDRNFKVHEKITSRDASRGTDSDASVLKYSDDYQILNALRQIEEQKHKSGPENKPPKMPPRSSSQPTQQKTIENSVKEQHKRIVDRAKASTSKSQTRPGTSSTAEISEDIETVSDSNSNKNRSIYSEISQQSKNKTSEASISPPNPLNVESQNIVEASTENTVLDTAKISFRDDSYSQQEEFCDLITPDINLTFRSKRRKQTIPEIDSEVELKTPKHKPSRSTETAQNSGAPLIHPTALHMQFQAELHLFDSYNESLRQVMDVEKCLYTVKHEKGKELLQKQKLANEELKKQLTAIQAEKDAVDLAGVTSPTSEVAFDDKAHEIGSNSEVDDYTNVGTNPHDSAEELQSELRKINVRHKTDGKDSKPDVKMAEVQTQTANDIATQTDTRIARHTVSDRLKQYPGITYDRGGLMTCDIPEFSLGSLEQFEDLDHIEDISLPSKMRTMSEISLHETTSSIKTETGTEISISTRDVTCSFNKYLDLEMAQLIKDEKLMYDKIEMLFKSREKTLNDRTRKLVKLEEQKRALRDTGQDSRISSVKKKQRALLLKLQQEKDEMNRLKELHKIASQERKLMLQKQRNMFNPQMSTKNILTKLKRSADCQSPRRLSGPMKGYDIRSNSSMSSLVDSDKSQLDRSQIDLKLQLSDSSHRLEGKSLKSSLETSAPEKLDASLHRKYMSVLEESVNSLNNLDQLNDFNVDFETPQKLESKTRKFEEKMPSLKSHYLGRPKHTVPLSHGQIPETTEGSKIVLQNVDNSENLKSESDTLVEELSKKSKPQVIESTAHIAGTLKDKDSGNLETFQGETESVNSRKSKASQVTEESLLINSKGLKKPEKPSVGDREGLKKSQHLYESKSGNKRKGSKNLKAKSTSNILTENRSQVSTLTISRHSSGDSEKSFSRSVVIRAQDHRFKTSKKLEQVLNAREAALTTRRNCVEDWIAWHTKLKAEESRVARMEQAAFKLVSTTANVLPYHDTTMSSDTSDVEGRVELLAEKLAERRAEMAKLKREVRRQAKQRLKALEANLLNQIKKYDTTIHEMRKKLETQKTAVKDNDRLAIESRSVADFKVPEIPIKRIQEIYKSSDLLRSRSESDLIFTKGSQEDTDTNAYTTDHQSSCKEIVSKSSGSIDNKNARLSKLSSTRDSRTHPSAESVLEEAKQFAYSNSEKSTDIFSAKELQGASGSCSEESIVTENVASVRNSLPSTLDTLKTVTDETKVKDSDATGSVENPNAILTVESDESSKVFSRKLESLQLTNKNLNDDISTLENDLKALSEMMSHFSKKSDEKLQLDSEPVAEQDDVTAVDNTSKNISKDISEELSKSLRSEVIEEISSVAEDLEQTVSLEFANSIPEHSSILENVQKSITSGHSNISDGPVVEVTEVMSVILPGGQSCVDHPAEEIDFEARSKEILNVIEASIISEHVKSSGPDLNSSGAALEKSMKDMHEENEALSQDLNSLEGDIKSISKILSKMAESKRSLDLAADLSESTYAVEGSLELREDTFDMPILQLDNQNQISTISDHEYHTDQNDGVKLHEVQTLKSPEQISTVADQPAPAFSVATPEKSVKEISIFDEVNNEKSFIDDQNMSGDSVRSMQTDIEEAESIAEELSVSQQEDYMYNESSLVSRNFSETSEREEEAQRNRSNESSLESSVNENNETRKDTDGISIGHVSIDNDWTISDSFQVPEKPDEVLHSQWEESGKPEASLTIERSDFSVMNLSDESRQILSPSNKGDTQNFTCDMDDVSMFIPKGESTTIGYKFEDSVMGITKSDSMHVDELDDILDIIERESKQTAETYREHAPEITAPAEIAALQTKRTEQTMQDPSNALTTTSNAIVPRPTDLNLTSEVEPVLQKLTEILQGVERNIARRRQNANDVDTNHESSDVIKSDEIKEFVPSLEGTSETDRTSKELSNKIEELENQAAASLSNVPDEVIIAEIDQRLQKDVAMLPSASKIEEDPDEISKVSENAALYISEPLYQVSHESFRLTEIADTEIDERSKSEEEAIKKLAEKTFEILRDPEYEDISEESLEVSEILDRSESQRSVGLPKTGRIPEKYEVTQKSEDVLRILDEISQKSYTASAHAQNQHLHDIQISVQVFGSVSPGYSNKKESAVNNKNEEPILTTPMIDTLEDHTESLGIEIASYTDRYNQLERLPDGDEPKEKYFRIATEPQDEICQKQEQDGSSESSEGADTPRGVSEIEMDSPRDPNESRLDVDALDDDLLSGNEVVKPENDANIDFHVTPATVTSEKDIKAMIDKLKASLEQPGLEVAELEAKLLRIEQLQIELEIKKLEAEEVSFYVREIPNKPPPPYTPPGDGRLSTPQVSPTLPPAVVPSNVEELTAFTEKATVLIFNAKKSGEDIMSLEPPPEICQLSKDNNETARQDRKIYNTFLFDLCKETIAELYRCEYEKPGPSWTKPNVKTKPAMKIPKTVEELNEYVSKEVATLFGFKTKLQRENMVMRWSRKRRDRVDELLAREAQAEEDEWTKFHHDELAVKNELTVAILDTLILETTNVVKAVYAKKRRVMV